MRVRGQRALTQPSRLVCNQIKRTYSTMSIRP